LEEVAEEVVGYETWIMVDVNGQRLIAFDAEMMNSPRYGYRRNRLTNQSTIIIIPSKTVATKMNAGTGNLESSLLFWMTINSNVLAS
jgi:hypothetical protein